VSILDGVFAARTRDECLRIAREAKLVFAPLNEPSDLADDPQAIANNYIIDVDYPGVGQVKMPGFPIQYSETPARFKVAPAPGSDTDEVLMEVGGLNMVQLQELKAQEVI
jgi:CoA:oxalate CoA-transferase